MIAKIHADRTWRGEHYENIPITLLILVVGCVAAVALGIAAIVRSAGDRSARRAGLLGVLGAILISAAGLLWVLL